MASFTSHQSQDTKSPVISRKNTSHHCKVTGCKVASDKSQSHQSPVAKSPLVNHLPQSHQSTVNKSTVQSKWFISHKVTLVNKSPVKTSHQSPSHQSTFTSPKPLVNSRHSQSEVKCLVFFLGEPHPVHGAGPGPVCMVVISGLAWCNAHLVV